jgi:hypothetical protein
MRKILSILFAALVLTSGMHLTVATHICCGELAAVKWSLTGEKATCGMEEGSAPCSKNGELNTNCCKNLVVACTADQNYYPVIQAAKTISVEITPLFCDTSFVAIQNPWFGKTYHSMVGPPVFESWSSVDQTKICVFII